MMQRGFLIHSKIARDNKSVVSPLEHSPQAFTVCPTAKMFLAAFSSLGLRLSLKQVICPDQFLISGVTTVAKAFQEVEFEVRY